MSDLGEIKHGDTYKDATRTVNLFRTLPFDVVEQIISGLPFETITALIATKDTHIIDCIRWSTAYKKVFHDVESVKDLENIAEILSFCHEVSPYRLLTNQLCRHYGQAARTWDPAASSLNDRPFDRPCRGLSQCPMTAQKPYHNGSVRGAKWNRALLYQNTSLQRPILGLLPPIERDIQIEVQQDARFEDLSAHSMTHRQYLEEKILKRIRSEYRLDPQVHLYFTKNCQDLSQAISTLPMQAHERGRVFGNVDISAGIENFLRGIESYPEALVEKLLRPFKQILAEHDELEFCSQYWPSNPGLPSRSRSRSAVIRTYRVQTSIVAHLLLEEILVDHMSSVIPIFAIRKLEDRISEKLRNVPASSYWFFNDFFNRKRSPCQRFQDILFSENDRRLCDDGQFWLESLHAGFCYLRGNQLLDLAETFNRYPFMLIHDGDPGSEARENFSHIRLNIVERAKKMMHRDPYRRRNHQPRWLMKCPGLPLIPLQKHLSFMLDMLVEHPIDLTSIEDPEQVREILHVMSQLRSRYQIPKLTRGDPVNQPTTDGMHTSISKLTLVEDGSDDILGRNANHLTPPAQGVAYPKDTLQSLITALKGLLIIHRNGLRNDICERIQGRYDNASLEFSRWRRGNQTYVEFTPYQIGEPFNHEDIEWLAAFLKCCEYFHNNLSTVGASRTAREKIQVFNPPQRSIEEMSIIKEERRKRKLRQTKSSK